MVKISNYSSLSLVSWNLCNPINNNNNQKWFSIRLIGGK